MGVAHGERPKHRTTFPQRLVGWFAALLPKSALAVGFLGGAWCTGLAFAFGAFGGLKNVITDVFLLQWQQSPAQAATETLWEKVPVDSHLWVCEFVQLPVGYLATCCTLHPLVA